MKNKKGFTLVELIATIGILVLMSLIIGVNISSILKSTEKNQQKNDKEAIQKAACVYAEVKGVCPNTTCNTRVTVQTLISEGLLDKTFNDRSSKTVSITKNNEGEKTCAYDG